MQQKAVLLEEAARVPLIIKFPGQDGMNTTNTTIRQPVTQMDLHATILDYLGAADMEASDGTSLRRFTDKLSYNKDFDESAVVVELDQKFPLDQNRFSAKLGESPNFMVRKGKLP